MKIYCALLFIVASSSQTSSSAFNVQVPRAAKLQLTTLNSFFTKGDVDGVGPKVDPVRGNPNAPPPPGRRGGGPGYPDRRGGGGPDVERRPATSLDPEQMRSIRERSIIIQGGSLRTWSNASPATERVQLMLMTEGRPLEASVDLWHGPNNAPQKIWVYSENGGLRPFNAIIETPRGHNALAIRNTGQMEFPMSALIETNVGDRLGLGPAKRLSDKSIPAIVQGGAVRTYPFGPYVSSVQVLLRTDGRPLNAKIELLQGPNNNKQVMEIYTEDGLERPFFAIIETPGNENVVRIVNTATVEFPLTACVEPYQVVSVPDGREYEIRGWDIGDANNGGMFSMNPQW